MNNTSLLCTVFYTGMRWQQKSCLKTGRSIKNCDIKHRVFKELCNEMGSEFGVLLYHSNVRCLSRGKVLIRVFAMRVELALFAYQHCHADCFENSELILILAYMSDIFDISIDRCTEVESTSSWHLRKATFMEMTNRAR
jgi:hypothetical protein